MQELRHEAEESKGEIADAREFVKGVRRTEQELGYKINRLAEQQGPESRVGSLQTLQQAHEEGRKARMV
jgi:pyruvate kinase